MRRSTCCVVAVLLASTFTPVVFAAHTQPAHLQYLELEIAESDFGGGMGQPTREESTFMLPALGHE